MAAGDFTSTFLRNWKTTAAGASVLLAVIGTTLNLLLDGDPKTNPDWNYVLPLVGSGLIGIFSKDHNVTGGKVE